MARPIVRLDSRRFGRLVVQGLSHKVERRCGKYNEGSILYWRCICECGNTHIVQGNDLKSGRVRSCGCLRKLG